MSKNREGLVQFVKFGTVGVLNTGVDWAVFFLLTSFVFSGKDMEPIAKAIAFLAAVINSFLLNTVWTFRKEFKSVVGSKKQVFEKGSGIFIKFFVVSLVGWGINYFSFKYARFNMDQSQIISLIAASGSATLWNFFANKLWTYKKVSS